MLEEIQQARFAGEQIRTHTDILRPFVTQRHTGAARGSGDVVHPIITHRQVLLPPALRPQKQPIITVGQRRAFLS